MNKFSTTKDTKMVNNEEFSFPIVPNPLASFMLSASSSSSSSLWRISSRVFHLQEEEYEGRDRQMEVQSMYEERYSNDKGEIEWSSCHGEELEMEERMDCLWEDFNEEKFDGVIKPSEVHFAKEIRLLQGQPPRMSARRPSKMVVMGKLFKGLVSIRKSAQQKIMKARF